MEYRTIRLKVPCAGMVREGSTSVEGPVEAVAAIRAFLEKEHAPMDREVFGIVALNARGKVSGAAVCFIGIATASLVHPREVFRDAIAMGAVQIIHFHTHPSGDPSPSSEDCMLHDRLKACGDLLGIPVLDGLVLGADRFVSLEST